MIEFKYEITRGMLFLDGVNKFTRQIQFSGSELAARVSAPTFKMDANLEITKRQAKACFIQGKLMHTCMYR